MKIILFISSFIFSATIMAQSYDSWKIYHNRKLSGSFNLKKETNNENKVVLLNRTLEGPGFLVIEFSPNKEQAEWIRTIAFVDSSDNSIREYNNTLLLRIHNAEIAGIMEGRQKVKVYSWAIPKDPAIAATVRVRRVLLCTLYTR
jgi:hypothetical protein